jgi:hypothetical protein
VSQDNDWTRRALCRRDAHPERWVSARRSDIEYSRSTCAKCTERPECLWSAVYSMEGFVGVNAGITEIEFLMKTWEEVEFEHETNWPGSDKLIQDLFREIL